MLDIFNFQFLIMKKLKQGSNNNAHNAKHSNLMLMEKAFKIKAQHNHDCPNAGCHASA